MKMAGGPSPVFPPEITKLSFFYTDFANSEEAANHVNQHNRGPGTFLLRPSVRSPGALTLTIITDQSIVRHVNVQMRVDERSNRVVSFHIIPERTFATFQDLYGYYSLNTICNLENVSNVLLLNPLEKSLRPSCPLVMPEEIPPLPRRQSTGSGIGSDSVKADRTLEDGRRISNASQPGLPKVPPLPVSPELSPRLPEIPPTSGFPEPPPGTARLVRPSLDSQGNDILTWSNNSSESGAASGRPPPRPGCFNGQSSQYLAPGSPGSNPARVQTSLGAAFPYPGPSSPPPPPSPLTKKQQKELEKREKEEKKKNKVEKKKNKDKKKQATEMSQMGELGWCRPPMPTPTFPTQPEESPYYTSPRAYRDHLEELKKMLRETEICDCGLRMLDAELGLGWTVHRSRESGTFKRVFYQHENGNTTWDFPIMLTEDLSDVQVKFIADLCREASQDLPVEVLRRYQRLTAAGSTRGNFPSTSSVNSSRSRSSSNSSDQLRWVQQNQF